MSVGKAVFNYATTEYIKPANSLAPFTALGKALSEAKPDGNVYYVDDFKECGFGEGYVAVFFPHVNDEANKYDLAKKFRTKEELNNTIPKH